MAQSAATNSTSLARRGMAYSLAMHALLLLVFMVGVPSFYKPEMTEEATAISVEILPIGEVSNVKPSNKNPPKKRPKEEPKPKEIISKTLEELTEKEEKPAPLVKTQEPAPAPPIEEEAQAELEKEPPKETQKKAEKPSEDPLDAILKGVKDTASKDKKTASTPSETDASSSGNRSNQFNPNAPETLAIRDAIQSQIYRCWNVPAGARDAQNLIVPLKIDYNQGGMPIKVELASSATSRYRSDSFYRAAADSAKRAVQRCAPLEGLPADSFHIWQYVNINFNPSEMLF